MGKNYACFRAVEATSYPVRKADMSSAPGWYPLANEPGMMGYWDGNGWTGHKQPLPPAQEAVPVSVHAPEAAQTVPQYAAAANPGAQASRPWSPEALIGTARRYVGDPGVRAGGTAAAGGALIADGVVGFGQNRQGLKGAIGTIIFGVVWLFLSLTPGMPLHNEVPRAGTIHTQATVTNVQVNDKGNCTPVAELVVDGKSYVVRSSVSQSPCPYMKGEKIDVTYYPDDVAATAAIPPSGFFKVFLTFAPWIGVLAVIGGVWTLIKRTAEIGGGIFLLRKGLLDRRAQNETMDADA
ncbi:DUF2510 domain-containing protein [Arthrobacter terrae]|uniref:DUF2510 domain-containing protein n=1 Tax=Arthrobacter terrae TaxID=2935737 RepID=UPI0028A6E0CF|nr:DUF2510 domain-containing protein [Arthrobacter terrae]